MNNPGRKFWITLLSLVSAHWALIENLIGAADYKAVMIGVVAVYVSGNVAQKVLQKPEESK